MVSLALPRKFASSKPSGDGCFRQAQLNQWVLAALCALPLTFMLGACRSQKASSREIWAEVDGHPIYRDEVESYYRRRFPEQQNVSREQALSLKLSLLNELIDN